MRAVTHTALSIHPTLSFLWKLAWSLAFYRSIWKPCWICCAWSMSRSQPATIKHSQTQLWLPLNRGDPKIKARV